MAKGYSLHIGASKSKFKYAPDKPLEYADFSAKAFARAFGAIGDWTAFELTSDKLGSGRSSYDNVTNKIIEIAAIARRDDIFVLSFSGHGRYVSDHDHSEVDGYDETWVLYDQEIRDDDVMIALHAFRPGVRIVVIADCCNSDSTVSPALDILADIEPSEPTSNMLTPSSKSTLEIIDDRDIGVWSDVVRAFKVYRNFEPQARTAIIFIGATARLQNIYGLGPNRLSSFGTALMLAFKRRGRYRSYYDFYLDVALWTMEINTDDHLAQPVYDTNEIRNYYFERSTPFTPRDLGYKNKSDQPTALLSIETTSAEESTKRHASIQISNSSTYASAPYLSITSLNGNEVLGSEQTDARLETTTNYYTLLSNDGSGTGPCGKNCHDTWHSGGGAQHIFVMIDNNQTLQINKNTDLLKIPSLSRTDGPHTMRAILANSCDECPKFAGAAITRGKTFYIGSDEGEFQLFDQNKPTLYLSSPRALGKTFGVNYNASGVVLDYIVSPIPSSGPYAGDYKVEVTIFNDNNEALINQQLLESSGPYCIVDLQGDAGSPAQYGITLRLKKGSMYFPHQVTAGSETIDLNEISFNFTLPAS